MSLLLASFPPSPRLVACLRKRRSSEAEREREKQRLYIFPIPCFGLCFERTKGEQENE